MKNKVILISIDGMRPDGLKMCGNEFLSEMERLCSYTYEGRSVFPSVTLPCHFSMTHSVVPDRHGILTNTYAPQVRPIKGIFEKVTDVGGECAFYYGWDRLRDIASPGSLKYATHINAYCEEYCDDLLTSIAIAQITKRKPDFAFLYLVDVDEKGGHDNGWMTQDYFERISIAINNVKRIFDNFKDEYSILVVSDHGGHDRTHGTRLSEDMTIPFFFYGKDFEGGKVLDNVSLLEITPTIAKIMGIEPERDWDGHPVF